MLATWTEVLATLALDDVLAGLRGWMRTEEWPPQASQLRERAILARKARTLEAEQAALLARYTRQPEPALPPLAERRRALSARLAESGGGRDAAGR